MVNTVFALQRDFESSFLIFTLLNSKLEQKIQSSGSINRDEVQVRNVIMLEKNRTIISYQSTDSWQWWRPNGLTDGPKRLSQLTAISKKILPIIASNKWSSLKVLRIL